MVTYGQDTVTNASKTVQQTIQSLQEGGFRLTKFDTLVMIPLTDFLADAIGYTQGKSLA